MEEKNHGINQWWIQTVHLQQCGERQLQNKCHPKDTEVKLFNEPDECIAVGFKTNQGMEMLHLTMH